ncbi:oligopeptide transporter ATP-binding component [compost metagenome]
MNSIPDIEHKDKPLPTIPGRVPSLAERGQGCPFAGRCTLTESVCRTHVPRLEPLADGHLVRCHLYGADGKGVKL